jgi:hypothetical protein
VTGISEWAVDETARERVRNEETEDEGPENDESIH